MALIEHFPFVGMDDNIIKKEKKINVNISLSIITSFTEREKAKLVNQLEDNNIEYINAVENVNDFKKAFKPIYYYDALKDVSTEYVLIIDSYDTVIYNVDDMPSYLNYYDKDVIYSAWNVHFPTFIDFDFSVPENNELKFLNSGVVFGKTEFVKQYFHDLSEYIKSKYDSSDNWLKDFEQYWVYKYLSENGDKVKGIGIDYEELIVQNNP